MFGGSEQFFSSDELDVNEDVSQNNQVVFTRPDVTNVENFQNPNFLQDFLDNMTESISIEDVECAFSPISASKDPAVLKLLEDKLTELEASFKNNDNDKEVLQNWMEENKELLPYYGKLVFSSKNAVTSSYEVSMGGEKAWKAENISNISELLNSFSGGTNIIRIVPQSTDTSATSAYWQPIYDDYISTAEWDDDLRAVIDMHILSVLDPIDGNSYLRALRAISILEKLYDSCDATQKLLFFDDKFSIDLELGGGQKTSTKTSVQIMNKTAIPLEFSSSIEVLPAGTAIYAWGSFEEEDKTSFVFDSGAPIIQGSLSYTVDGDKIIPVLLDKETLRFPNKTYLNGYIDGTFQNEAKIFSSDELTDLEDKSKLSLIENVDASLRTNYSDYLKQDGTDSQKTFDFGYGNIKYPTPYGFLMKSPILSKNASISLNGELFTFSDFYEGDLSSVSVASIEYKEVFSSWIDAVVVPKLAEGGSLKTNTDNNSKSYAYLTFSNWVKKQSTGSLNYGEGSPLVALYEVEFLTQKKILAQEKLDTYNKIVADPNFLVTNVESFQQFDAGFKKDNGRVDLNLEKEWDGVTTFENDAAILDKILDKPVVAN